MDVNNNKSMRMIRILFFLIGLILISLGISVSIVSDFGIGGWDAFNIGLKQHFGFTIGTWMNICAACFIILSAMLQKKRPMISTIITSLVIGIGTDMWMTLFQDIVIPSTLVSFITFIIAITIIAFGAGMYLVSELPPNPIDLFMMSISERFQISIMYSKMMIESTGLILGFLSGGPIGFGSLIMIICFGPLIQFFYQRFKRFYRVLEIQRKPS